MTTASKTVTANEVSDDFADLLGLTATTEPKQVKGGPEWDESKTIPPVFYTFVEMALADLTKRVKIVINPDTNLPQLHAGLRKVAAELAPELELHARPRKDKNSPREDKVVEFNFSLGAKRGRKNTDN